MIIGFFKELLSKLKSEPESETPLDDWATPQAVVAKAYAGMGLTPEGNPLPAPEGVPELPVAEAPDFAIIKRANAKLASLRAAEFVAPNGELRNFSCKTPDWHRLNHWVAMTREELKMAASYTSFNSKHATTYKLAKAAFPKEMQFFGKFQRMPLLNARIIQNKRATRGGNRRLLKKHKAQLLDKELATLKSMARNINFACEWINSGLALCVYLDRKFGDTWTVREALVIVKAIEWIHYNAVS